MATLTKEELIQLVTNVVDKALATSDLKESGELYPSQVVSKKYESTADLPEAVKKLPEHAQKIFLAAFNSSYDPKDEVKSFAIAWGAVKRKYKNEKGEWTTKSLFGPIVGDVDQLRRQLMIDGYVSAAESLVPFVFDGVPEEDVQLDLSELPEDYKEVIADRYGHARKSDEVIEVVEKEFLIEVAFKALIPEKRLTYGVVYPPNFVDLQKEWAKADIIEEAAHSFMRKYREQDTFHNEQGGAGVPVESFIAPCDITEFHGKKLEKDEIIPAGSWVMATEWTPDNWALVKSGKIKGYSIGGFKKVRQ